jgi:hypothetical protein
MVGYVTSCQVISRPLYSALGHVFALYFKRSCSSCDQLSISRRNKIKWVPAFEDGSLDRNKEISKWFYFARAIRRNRVHIFIYLFIYLQRERRYCDFGISQKCRYSINHLNIRVCRKKCLLLASCLKHEAIKTCIGICKRAALHYIKTLVISNNFNQLYQHTQNK